MYVFTIKTLFQKIQVETTKQPCTKKKHQSLLHAIGGGWYAKKLGQKLPPPKRRKLSKNPKRGG